MGIEIEVKREVGFVLTGKITNGDGECGNGGETKVIESVEISDGFSEWWVSI